MAAQRRFPPPAAIRPYSMAVAPDSSLRKALSVCMAPVDSTAAVIVLLLRSQKGPGRSRQGLVWAGQTRCAWLATA